MMTISLTELELKAIRTGLSPATELKLRQLSAAAHVLADLLRDEPGAGIGLDHALVYDAWRQADAAMRKYQNIFNDPE